MIVVTLQIVSILKNVFSHRYFHTFLISPPSLTETKFDKLYFVRFLCTFIIYIKRRRYTEEFLMKRKKLWRRIIFHHCFREHVIMKEKPISLVLLHDVRKLLLLLGYFTKLPTNFLKNDPSPTPRISPQFGEILCWNDVNSSKKRYALENTLRANWLFFKKNMRADWFCLA